jgi:hypothetical protein
MSVFDHVDRRGTKLLGASVLALGLVAGAAGCSADAAVPSTAAAAADSAVVAETASKDSLELLTQPEDFDLTANADSGGDVTFGVTVFGPNGEQILGENEDPSLTYLWERSTDGGSTWSPAAVLSPETTTTAMAISKQDVNVGDLFRVTVTSPAQPQGVTSNPAAVTAEYDGKPTVDAAAEDVTVARGDTLTLNTQVKSWPIAEGQWEINLGQWGPVSERDVAMGGGANDPVESSNDTTTFTFDNVDSAADGLQYRYVATNALGTAVKTFTVHVTE